MPVLYYTQLLGLALGVPEKELWFRMNSVKPSDMRATVVIE